MPMPPPLPLHPAGNTSGNVSVCFSSPLSQRLLLSDLSVKTVPDKMCDLGQAFTLGSSASSSVSSVTEEVRPLRRKWWPRARMGSAPGHMASGLLALNLHKHTGSIDEPSCTHHPIPTISNWWPVSFHDSHPLPPPRLLRRNGFLWCSCLGLALEQNNKRKVGLGGGGVRGGGHLTLLCLPPGHQNLTTTWSFACSDPFHSPWSPPESLSRD